MNKRNINKYILITVLIGTIIGCIIYFYFTVNNINIIDYINQNIFYNLKSFKSETSDKISIYIIKNRLIQLIIFIAISYFVSYAISTVLYALLIGMIYGFSYCGLFYYFGFNGILKTVVFVFPQYFFYLLFIIFFGEWIESYISGSNNTYYKNINTKKYIKIIFIILIYVVGLILEINIKKYFKFF